jgi:hypothetical protein
VLKKKNANVNQQALRGTPKDAMDMYVVVSLDK